VTTEPAGDLQQIGSQEKVIFCARCDPRSLATALLPLIANRKVLDRLRAAPNPLKEYFRWDLIVRQYIDIYRLVRNLK
jgi:glycosyltransferase involved in cell wall biosynthesis